MSNDVYIYIYIYEEEEIQLLDSLLGLFVMPT